MAEVKKQSENTKSAKNKEAAEKVVKILRMSAFDNCRDAQVTVVDVIKQLMRNGIMANINQVIDFEVAEKVVSFYGYKAERGTDYT